MVKSLNAMTKVQIKSERHAPFGGFFPIIEHFDALSAQAIDATLGWNVQDMVISIANSYAL